MNWNFPKSNKVTNCIIVVGIIILISSLCVIFSDTKSIKSNIDGLVLTDKAGKSYIVEHSFSNKFKLTEFDVTLMRAKR